MTGALIKIDNQGRLIGCNAGSPACIILRTTGEVISFFAGGGTALGMFEDERVPYQDESQQLFSGDRIVLLTDGLLERRNHLRQDYGLERATASLQKNRQQPLKTMLDNLELETNHFAQAIAQDDYTLLAIEYLGPKK